MTDKIKLLIIDDEPNNIRTLQLDLEDQGYEILTANDGLEGWEILQKHKDEVRVILLDRMMPNMNGMEFMEKLNQDASLSNIPVIMQTAAAEKDQVVEGIESGVYYYLTKPYEKEIMLSIVLAAIQDHKKYSNMIQDIKMYKSKLHLVRNSCFEVRSIDDAEYLSTFLANFFPDPERVVLGISELIINAIEHGNLGITYEEKSRLTKENKWMDEVYRRLELPENKDKKAEITYDKDDQEITLIVKDQGSGFNWQDYLEISPDRASHNHGRGIAMAKMVSFDSMEYVGCGNEVVCKIRI